MTKVMIQCQGNTEFTNLNSTGFLTVQDLDPYQLYNQKDLPLSVCHMNDLGEIDLQADQYFRKDVYKKEIMS